MTIADEAVAPMVDGLQALLARAQAAEDGLRDLAQALNCPMQEVPAAVQRLAHRESELVAQVQEWAARVGETMSHTMSHKPVTDAAGLAPLQEWQRRVMEERRELLERLGRLDVFLGSTLYASLDADERDRMARQRGAMGRYADILGERIEAWEPAAANAPTPAPATRLTTDPADPRLTHGSDTAPRPQAEAYLVASDEELAKGFVRPVRTSYLHATCGAVTTMGGKLADTYARDPKFYSGTYCAHCQMHRPVGEFTWTADGSPVGS